MTTRMYGGQRSGDKNTSNGNWLLFGHSLANDGRTFLNDADGSYDLSGGWFDCGDHVKFGHTEFWSAYLLLKGFAEFAPGYDDRYAANYQGYRNANNYTFEGNGHAPNNIPDILDEVKHATDYLIKCTRDNNTFYYQVGDGGADHMEWVTSAKMQNNPVNTGGQPRAIHKNPNDGAMPSLAGAALALMSRLYRPYDANYADLCLAHAKYAYNYAKPRKTQTVGAPGGFYGTNANPLNAYAILLTELYWASKDEAYKTEAMAMTVDASSGSANVRGNPFGLDYVNNGDIAVYNMFLLGKPGAEAAFNTIANTHYIGNVQSDGQFAGGNTSWGPLRYNASAALVVALWTKRNSITTAAKTFIYSNVDFILGKNTRNYSFVVGFASNGASHPHHRNVFMNDGNNNSNLTIPTKNQQHGYMVGGKRNPNDYQDVTNSYQNTEGGIDYNSALVGVLAWINIQVAPVNKYTVQDVVVVTPTVSLTAPANNSTACAGTAITITANASISSGSISKVDFYDGATLLGSDNSNPYSYTWNSPSAGAHTVKAIAVSADNVSSTEATANITVNQVPGAPTVSTPVTYCQNATATALTAGGSNLKWYTDPTTGTGNTSAPTPSTGNVGTVNYYVSQTSGGCESGRSMIAVVTNALPSAPTVTSPVNYCQNATASALTAGGTGLKWYTSPSTGTGNSTAPTPVTSSVGTVNYYVSQTSNSCEGPRATIAVVTNALPSAPTVSSPVNYCHNATATALTAGGTDLKWYTSPSTGTGSSNAPTPVTSSVGTVNYYVSQTSNSCEGPRATIAVVTNALPDAVISPTGSTTFCQGESVTLNANSGSSYKWFNGAAQVGTNQSLSVNSSGNYTVEVTNSAGCKKTSSITTVTVTAPTTWYADGDGDGKGNPNSTLSACTQPAGYVAAAGDGCPDDGNKSAPGNCGCGNTETSCLDCAGVPNGTAALDACQRCAGGTTGVTPITNSSSCGPLSNADPSAAAFIRLTPNPSNDQFSLELPFSSDVKIVTTDGKQVDLFSDVESIRFGSDYAKGLYFIHITNDHFNQVLRVVKQ